MSDVQRIGPYRIIRTVAIGGMGEVFLATLERSGGFEKRVALKCVLPRLMADPHFVELFEREARLAAALSHRHIVQIFDFGRDQGRSWLAMEYVQGVDLKAVLDGLAGGGPMPLGLAVEIGVACARGLDYAHRARDPRGRSLHLVHRDVSPQNVLLSFEGDVKLADFGLAHAAARDPHEGGLQGKFAYMSPEQVEGLPLDGRSDQFALGVVLYEMVSGRRAFFADDGVEQILDRVRRAAPLAPLAEVAPELPHPIRRVIERALRADRTERFSDTHALAEALAGAAGASGLRPGEPALGPWLRARFPDRSRPPRPAIEPTAAAARPVSAPVEITAVAGQPIAPPAELTVDADAPARLRIDPLAATPSGAGYEEADPSPEGAADGPAITPVGAPDRHTAVLEVPAEPAEGSAADRGRPEMSEPPAAAGAIERHRRLWPAALVLLLAGAWFGWQALDDRPGSRAPRSADRAIAEAPRDAERAPDAARDALPPDAARDAMPPDAARDAAPLEATSVDAAPPDLRRATARPRPPTAPSAASPPPPDAATPPPDAARPPPAPDAAPPDPTPPPAGPRVRMFTPDARVAGPPAVEGWWPVPEGGLLLRVLDGPGPPVVLRVRARGGRFEAAVDARPWGQVRLGDRDLGPTPAAAVPLDLGRQTLRVVGPDGGETVMRIEASRN